jgi:hypothetical protein
MFRKTRRIAVLAAVMAAVGATSISVAPASANPVAFQQCVTEFFMNPPKCLPIHATLNGWPITGSLTTNGLKGPSQTLTLPSGATFSGVALIECRPCEGGVTGEIDGFTVIPPFTQTIEFPAKSTEHQVAGVELKEVGSVLGSITSASSGHCPSPIVGSPLTCVLEVVPTDQELTYSVHGPGNGLPSTTVSHCETTTAEGSAVPKPVHLQLEAYLTLLEIVAIGAHFAGTTTIPEFTCYGKYANGRESQVTETFSGAATFSINVNPPM